MSGPTGGGDLHLYGMSGTEVFLSYTAPSMLLAR